MRRRCPGRCSGGGSAVLRRHFVKEVRALEQAPDGWQLLVFKPFPNSSTPTSNRTGPSGSPSTWAALVAWSSSWKWRTTSGVRSPRSSSSPRPSTGRPDRHSPGAPARAHLQRGVRLERCRVRRGRTGPRRRPAGGSRSRPHSRLPISSSRSATSPSRSPWRRVWRFDCRFPLPTIAPGTRWRFHGCSSTSARTRSSSPMRAPSKSVDGA